MCRSHVSLQWFKRVREHKSVPTGWRFVFSLPELTCSGLPVQGLIQKKKEKMCPFLFSWQDPWSHLQRLSGNYTFDQGILSPCDLRITCDTLTRTYYPPVSLGLPVQRLIEKRKRMIQKTHTLGGFGLTPNVFTQISAKVAMSSRFLQLVGYLPPEEQP